MRAKMIALTAALVLASLPVVAQTPDPMPSEFTFTVTPQEAGMILRGLSEIPLKDSSAIYSKLQQQAQQQIEKARQPSPPPKTK